MAKPKSITINGHHYASMSAADREIGLPKGTIDRRIRDGWNPDDAANISTNRRGRPQDPNNIVGLVASHLLEEWDYERNPTEINPYNLGATGGIKYWWVCSKCDHSWDAVIADRTKGSGCPNCHEESHAKNQLSITNPELKAEWHVTKNRPIKFKDVYGGSNKLVWWKCLKGHKPYKKSPLQRKGGSRCFDCTKLEIREKRLGRPSSPGNTVKNVAPHLIAQWHPERNDPKIDIANWAASSSTVFWWVCPFGHEWPSAVAIRTAGHGCAKCSNQTSFPEIVIYCELGNLFENVFGGPGGCQVENYKVDVCVDDIRTIFEYDGKRWHSPPFGSPATDRKKTRLLRNLGYTVIRIREAPLKVLSDNDIEVNVGTDPKVLMNSLVLKLLTMPLLNRTQKSGLQSYLKAPAVQKMEEIQTLFSQLPAPQFERSLEHLFPHVAKEWHEDNLPIKPHMVTHGSKRVVTWRCTNCGHVWPAAINNRTKAKPSGCPQCARKAVGAKISAARIGKEQKGKKIKIDGRVFYSYAAAAREYRLPLPAVKNRLARGWSINKSFKTPIQQKGEQKGKGIKYQGKTFPSIAALAREYKKDSKTVERRLRYGYSVKDALCMPLNQPRKNFL